MTTHTPGPWTIGPHQKIISTGWSIRINDDSAIAYVLGEKNPELQANARLISAAPEMFAALQWFDEQMRDDSALDMGKLINEMEQRTRAAIAKATQEATQ